MSVSPISPPLYYQSRSIYGTICRKYLNLVNYIASLTTSIKNNFYKHNQNGKEKL